MRTLQWDHGLDRTHLQVSQLQHWRTRTDNGNAIFDSGRQPRRCSKNRQGGWVLRQLKGESRTAAEVVMDDALVQDDGIDLIVEEHETLRDAPRNSFRRSKRRECLAPTSGYRGQVGLRPFCHESRSRVNQFIHDGRAFPTRSGSQRRTVAKSFSIC